AETDVNSQVPRVLQGQSDTDLNEAGLKQAIALAKYLKKETFDHFYCSDLKRSQQTLKEIQKFHPSVPVHLRQELREQDLGNLTGLSWPLAKKILKKADKSMEEYMETNGTGESNQNFFERTQNFYTEIVKKHLVEPHSEILKKNMQIFENNLKLIDNEKVDKTPNDSELKSIPIERRTSREILSSKCSLNSLLPGSIPSDDDLTAVGSKNNSCHLNIPQQQPQQKLDSLKNLKKVLLEKQIKMKETKILLMTHGGFIQNLLKFLKDELHFELKCEYSHGFPKCTGIYKFLITKIEKPNFDYDWLGKIVLINGLSHLAVQIKKEYSKENLTDSNSSKSSLDKSTIPEFVKSNSFNAAIHRVGSDPNINRKNLGW
ncbi:hypothetical protein HK099_008674, partial [Clydaea vesicula]